MRTRCSIGEDIAEIEYQPLKCSRPYRLIIVRKNISVQKGEQVLFDEIRYFFYITNRVDYPGEQIVSLANGRCNQENVIEQLKNGVNAMRMPVDDLLSNWAYMVMTSIQSERGLFQNGKKFFWVHWSGYPDSPFGRGSSRGCPETSDFSRIPQMGERTDS